MNMFLLLLSAIAMIVSLVFGFQNRGSLIQTRKQKDETNGQIKAKIKQINDVNDEIETVISDKQAMHGEKSSALAALDSAERKLGEAKQQRQNVSDLYASNKARFDDLNEKLKPLEELGYTPETLSEDIDRKKTLLADHQEELKSLTRDIEIAEQNLRKNKNSLTRQVTAQEVRTQSFNVNSLEATVTAVDRAWGFAVVNAGESDGVTPELELIVVTPEREPKAKLNIIQLENGKLVANIDYDSAEMSGQAIRPGDRVILRKPNTGLQ